MKQKTIPIVAAIVAMSVLSACQTTRNSPERNADIRRDIRIAQANFEERHEQACIIAYKASMHDPSSFQMAGELELNQSWMDVTYGQTWDYLPPRRAVFTAPVRGKNKFGGLVLNEMRCIYGVTDNGISFAAVKSR